MTINSGSSSLKFKLYEMPEEKVLCSGNWLLPKEVDKYRFSYKKGETSYIVEIKKPKGRYAYKASSVNVDGVSRELASIRFNENDGRTHHIAVVLE